MGKIKYSKEQKLFAKRLLTNTEVPRDALPYTQEFDNLFHQYHKKAFPRIDEHTFWQLLCRAGKEGGARNKKLVHSEHRRMQRQIIDLTQDDAFELLRLCPEAIGSRDRLPYTTEFDDMYRLFNAHTGKTLNKNAFWRILSRLAKKSRKPKPIEYTHLSKVISPALESFLFRINPWWKQLPMKPVPAYRRGIYKELYEKATKPISPIIAVRGPRQSGKTTLQMQMIEDILKRRLVQPIQILFVQFDDLPSLSGCDEPILSIIDWYEKNILCSTINAYANKKKPIFIFLDEVQNLKAWDAQLKVLIDHTTCQVYITGSSALRIQHGRDTLAGRILQKDLGLLSLPEIIEFREAGHIEPFDPRLTISRWIDISFWKELSCYDGGKPILVDSAFGDFNNFGGYPFCHNRKDRDWADVQTYLIQSVVERTVQHDLRVGGIRRNAKLMREVFKLAARYTGQAPKLQTLATEISKIMEGKIMPSEVSNCLEFLENSLLLKLIPPLEIRTSKQSAPTKICICDHAIRAAWLNERISLISSSNVDSINKDVGLAGHIIEGIVGYFLSRISGVGLSYLPVRYEEPEVDYIMIIGDTRIPIEVKYRPNALNASFTNGLSKFMEKKLNNAPFGLIISKEDSGCKDNIVAIPAKKFLLLQ